MKDNAVITPNIYKTWVDVLDKFAAGDNTVVDEMKKGTLHWNQEVGTRFIAVLFQTIQARIDLISIGINKGFKTAHSVDDIIQTLLNARKKYDFLLNAVILPCLPNKVQENVKNAVISNMREVQKSLEKSAIKNDHSINQELVSVIRNTPVYKELDPNE